MAVYLLEDLQDQLGSCILGCHRDLYQSNPESQARSVYAVRFIVLAEMTKGLK